MDDPDSPIITMLKDDVVLFLVIMIVWDLLRACLIAWLIPKFALKKKRKKT